MRTVSLILATIVTTCLAISMGWLLSTDCPSNKLILSSSLAEPMTAEIFVQDKLIWSGSRNGTEIISFSMSDGESQFLIRRSNATAIKTGYIEKSDGRDHILFLDKQNVFYGSVDRGLFELIRRRAACWN